MSYPQLHLAHHQPLGGQTERLAWSSLPARGWNHSLAGRCLAPLLHLYLCPYLFHVLSPCPALFATCLPLLPAFRPGNHKDWNLTAPRQVPYQMRDMPLCVMLMFKILKSVLFE